MMSWLDISSLVIFLQFRTNLNEIQSKNYHKDRNHFHHFHDDVIFFVTLASSILFLFPSSYLWERWWYKGIRMEKKFSPVTISQD